MFKNKLSCKWKSIIHNNKLIWVIDRCAAAVGYFPLETGIDIFLGGPFCFVKGKIQHEILHTLGFWHEHTRPDRDSYVQVFFENVGTGKQ